MLVMTLLADNDENNDAIHGNVRRIHSLHAIHDEQREFSNNRQFCPALMLTTCHFMAFLTTWTLERTDE